MVQVAAFAAADTAPDAGSAPASDQAQPADQSAGADHAAAAPVQASPAVPADVTSTESPTPAESPAVSEERQERTAATAAVAAVTAEQIVGTHRRPDLLEHLVDAVLAMFNIPNTGNTPAHYIVSVVFLVMALLARRIVTGVIFAALKRLAQRTKTTLDDNLFPAMEGPTAAFVVVTGIFAALTVLKLSPESDLYIDNGCTVAFALVIFWGFWRFTGALLDHAQEIAQQRQLSIAGFMPWIKKTLLTMLVVVAVLLTIQSLGYDVKALLAGLGIGGLAFALAAQDTLANLFGSIVVATDQPFKIGEAIKIGSNIGIVEDIGLRSTRLRLLDKSLMVIPNKTVAAESITNFSRFTRRRTEQVLTLTYDATPEQMATICDDLRNLLQKDREVDPSSVMVFFRDLNSSSLDIWVVYEMPDPDFIKSMYTRQRLNQAFMQAVAARGLSFAFPTQTIQLDGPVARQLAQRQSPV